MKISPLAITIATLLPGAFAWAHDPSKHPSSNEAPRCEALSNLDSKSLNKDDPVVQALLQKCKKQLQKKPQLTEEEHTNHGGTHGEDH